MCACPLPESLIQCLTRHLEPLGSRAFSDSGAAGLNALRELPILQPEVLTMDKSQIRKEMRQRRRSVSRSDRKNAEKNLARSFHSVMKFCSARRVALYLENDGEIGTGFLIRKLWKRGVQVYLPVIHPFHNGYLTFIEYTPNTRMRHNRFRIPEPDFRSGQRVQARFLTIICLPLVAFDQQGNRLGMGGGFYDRTLSFLKETPSRKTLIGCAWEFQAVATLPADSWDIPLSAIATDKTVRLV